MQQIVECVPNFSEGRRPEIIQAIADSIRRVAGAHVLDVSTDPDHNRSVITFVGDVPAVEEASFQAIKTASQLINLDKHSGEHPRIGATDVCPFIPVKGISIEDCVSLANRLGQRVGQELGIAVYLYGSAATRPDRIKLADIRRGQYEAWCEEVGIVPERQPDYGPAVAKSWGATVIGVRPFLIAYNLYLNSDDVEIAGKIARAIRFSSGGLRHIQAMGFLVEGQAQVSMNLTDFNRTAVYRVQEMVRREAARYGLSITKAELVGMIPKKALLDSAKWYLQLDDLEDDHILEHKIELVRESDFTPYTMLEATAAGKPTPGGGSTAALAASLSAALTEMVANLTVGRKKYAEVEGDTIAVLAKATELRQDLTAAIMDDSEAFNQLMAAWRNKALDDHQRADAVEKATVRAGLVPLGVARASRALADLALFVTQNGNVNAISDAAAAGLMADAAGKIAALNVKINAQGLKDRRMADDWLQEVDILVEEISRIADQIVNAARARGGL